MAYSFSPMRYPGGKSKLAFVFGKICKKNNIDLYIEPFVGGGSVAMYLLVNEIVDKVIINDIDPLIYSFWFSVFYKTDELLELIEKTPVTLDERYKQKHIIKNYIDYDIVKIGFATFFLNRTNHSGILKAGVIGGSLQKGEYNITARYNKDTLMSKIIKLSNKNYRDRIIIYNHDAVDLLQQLNNQYNDTSLIYLDPPYVDKAEKLYNYYYKFEKHIELSKFIKNLDYKWILTYDNTDIIKYLYKDYNKLEYQFNYTIPKSNRVKGSELLIYNNIKTIQKNTLNI